MRGDLFKSLFALAVASLLAACVPGPNAATSVEVQAGMNLGVPRGYCLDQAASTISEEGSTLLLGRCRDDSKAIPAILRVSFGPPGSASVLAADPADLAAFFTSAAGRATLSPTGNPRDVRVIKALSQDGDFLLHIASAREGQYWRAISGLKGRLVTISAIGTAQVPLAAEQGRELVQMMLAAQRAAN